MTELDQKIARFYLERIRARIDERKLPMVPGDASEMSLILEALWLLLNHATDPKA